MYTLGNLSNDISMASNEFLLNDQMALAEFGIRF